MTMQPQFDAKAYKVTTHNQWQEAAKAWNDWGVSVADLAWACD